MRIIAFPLSGIAYNDSFYSAIASKGVTAIEGHWEGRWLLSNLKPGDVVHFHWPSFLYRPHGPFSAIAKGFIRFVILLFVCRLKTRRIWWTAHNLYPHQRSRLPILDVFARRLLIGLSEGVLVHGKEAKKLISNEFPAAAYKCLNIPHGHWIEKYPEGPGSDKAREKLGLHRQTKCVYLLFGQCQPYKNIPTLIHAFREVAREEDILIIAGRFSSDDYLNEVVSAANGDSRIRIDNRFIPDCEVPLYFNAANLMCIPYSEILTSGSAMLALGYGVPVISIDKGYLSEFVPSSCGILIESANFAQLCNALRRARNNQWNRAEIIKHARNLSFDDAADIFIDALTG